MHASEEQQLVKMINQIAANNISVGDEDAVAGFVFNHIDKFWSRRMKDILVNLLNDGCEDFHPAARKAAEQIKSARAAA